MVFIVNAFLPANIANALFLAPRRGEVDHGRVVRIFRPGSALAYAIREIVSYGRLAYACIAHIEINSVAAVMA